MDIADFVYPTAFHELVCMKKHTEWELQVTSWLEPVKPIAYPDPSLFAMSRCELLLERLVGRAHTETVTALVGL